MIKNISITTPTIGRIAIGEMRTTEDGRRQPVRLNHFMITTQFKKQGEWVTHPIQQHVEAATGAQDGKLKTIPVKLMFNTPELNVTSRLEAYNQHGQLVCAGNGEKARRVVDNAIETVDCVGCDSCKFGIENRCDKFVRLNVLINVEAADYPMDGMSGFIVRSRGHNTYKALTGKIERLAKLFKGKLIGIPMVLRLIGKSSKTSKNAPFYYVALDLAQDIIKSAEYAKAARNALAEADIDQQAYEEIALEQLSRGVFFDSEEEALELEEFPITFDPDEPTRVGEETKGNGLPPQLTDSMPDIGLGHLRQLIAQTTQAAAAQGAKAESAADALA